jgi:hypothetical protein
MNMKNANVGSGNCPESTKKIELVARWFSQKSRSFNLFAEKYYSPQSAGYLPLNVIELPVKEGK